MRQSLVVRVSLDDSSYPVQSSKLNLVASIAVLNYCQLISISIQSGEYVLSVNIDVVRCIDILT